MIAAILASKQDLGESLCIVYQWKKCNLYVKVTDWGLLDLLTVSVFPMFWFHGAKQYAE